MPRSILWLIVGVLATVATLFVVFLLSLPVEENTGGANPGTTPGSGELAGRNDLVVCLGAAGVESRPGAGIFVETNEDLGVDGEGLEIGPAAKPDALVLVVTAKQADDAKKLETELTDSRLVGQNVLVMPPSIDVALGSKPAGDPVPGKIIDQVRACVPA